MRLLAANDARVPKLDIPFFFFVFVALSMSTKGRPVWVLGSKLLVFQSANHGKPTDA